MKKAMKLQEIHKFNYKVGYDNLDMYSVMYHPEYLKLCDKARNEAFKHVKKKDYKKSFFHVLFYSINTKAAHFSGLFLYFVDICFSHCFFSQNVISNI